MNKYRQKLEYDKIVLQLVEKASFSMGKERCLMLEPMNGLAEVTAALEETGEARDILRLYPTYSLGGVRDIREAMKRAALGGIMNLKELVDVADTCRAARQNKDFFTQVKGQFPILKVISKELGIFKTVENAIEKAVTPENTVADGASERLYQIRRKINTHQSRIKERLDNFIKSPNTAKYLQDPIVTIRGDRYVVPVKQEYRSNVPGMVHDMSASGSTLFIEPMAVMEANNELIKLRAEEEEEIIAILRALTMVVLNFHDEIILSLEELAHLDFIFAKAHLSVKMDGTAPKINNNGIINLKKARHPLIQGKVVPIDVHLDKNLQAMVITGPNTGGKTVTLKTIGLLTLMALSGLHIPADDGTEIAYFQEIYADIGDEQSIEQSLSTFSAHMTNIVQILSNANENTLILMDELGSGTDPTEGAALAMSILEYLQKVKAKVIATTHYSELKSFAYNRAGFINASVEFDVESLRPTYRLLMGVPGKSNAFEISLRLGLNEAVIQRANTFISTDKQEVADLISNLEQNRLYAEEARKEAELIQARLVEKEREINAKQVDLHNQEAAVMRKAHEEGLKLVEETRAASEQLYKSLKDQLKYVQGAGKEIQAAREKLKKMEGNLRDKLPKDKYLGEAPKTVEPGDLVEIPKLRQKGQVLSLPDEDNNVLIQVGIMKITLKLADLRKDESAQAIEKNISTNRVRTEKAKTISAEIDLRGMMVDEAVDVIDKYLDDAFISGLKQVRIIHGKGTGALRAGLTPYLKKHRLVKKIRIGDYYEGGIGVTVIELNN
ncbi:MAG: endonuclease MutS2 [Clostridia bacterium]|nr:endonuclease MutS2 [Clostridia bacterium]